MATAREYLEKLETGQLESLLTREAYGADKFNLSMIYLICAILSEREPRRGSAGDVFLEFAGRYVSIREFVQR